jgi:hypothetical protein
VPLESFAGESDAQQIASRSSYCGRSPCVLAYCSEPTSKAGWTA